MAGDLTIGTLLESRERRPRATARVQDEPAHLLVRAERIGQDLRARGRARADPAAHEAAAS